MTTAQERRRAKRIARRAALERAVPAAVPEVVVVEQPTPPTTAAPRLASAPRSVPRVAEHPPVAPPIHRNGMHHWVPVKSARPDVGPVMTARAESQQQKRWVAVKARAATVEGVEAESPAPEPEARESLEALPREPGDDADRAFDDASPESPESRALHPRSRAIRITRVKANGKRRWSVDFLVRGPDMHLPRQ